MKKNELVVKMVEKINKEIMERIAPQGVGNYSLEKSATKYAEDFVHKYKQGIVYTLLGMKAGVWGLEVNPETKRELKRYFPQQKIDELYKKVFGKFELAELAPKDVKSVQAHYKEALMEALKEKAEEFARAEADRMFELIRKQIADEDDKIVASV
jgi:hypothetical protein